MKSKLSYLLILSLLISLNANGTEITNNACDVRFANFFQALLDERSNIDTETLGEDFIDGMRISAEDMMLALSSFDSEGCTSEIKKRIQTLFNHGARLQTSYKKMIELRKELEITQGEEKLTVYDKLREQREKNRILYKAFLDNKSSLHLYVLPAVDRENLK